MQVRNRTLDLKSLAIPAECLTVQNKHTPKCVHNQMYRPETDMGSLKLMSMESLRGPAGVGESGMKQRCPAKTLWMRGHNLP